MNVLNVNVIVPKVRQCGFEVYSIPTTGLTLMDLHTLTSGKVYSQYTDCYLRDTTLEEIDYEYFVYASATKSSVHVKDYGLEPDCDYYSDEPVIRYIEMTFTSLLKFVDNSSDMCTLDDCTFSHALQSAMLKDWSY